MRRDLTFIIILAACGPQSSDTTEGSSDSSSATGSATGSDTGSATGSGSSPTEATGTPTGSTTDTPTTGEPLTCEVFLPPPPEVFKSVEITIISKLAQPVWIGAKDCNGLPGLRILDAGEVDVFNEPESCFPQQCHDFLGSQDCSLGCDACQPALARRIGPGSSFAMNWAAARFVPMQMTEACAPGTDCQRECLRPEPVPAGDYSVELTAFRACDGPCECDVADPNASCALWDPIKTGDPFDVKVSLSYPDTDKIELVLE